MLEHAQIQESAVNRFWFHTRKGTPDECWPFVGNLSTNGYGRLKIRRKWIRAHRFSYEIHTGDVPVGLVVRHTCDNKICVNPGHLILGTHADNAQDCITRNRKKPTRGSAHPYAKLTEADIPVIIDAIKAGESMASVARRYGIGMPAISNIFHRKTWKHVQISDMPI